MVNPLTGWTGPGPGPADYGQSNMGQEGDTTPVAPAELPQYKDLAYQAAGYSGEFSFSDTVWDGYATKNDMSYPTYQYYASSYEFVKSQLTVYGQNNNRFAALVRSTNSCSN